jgi:flagellar L-ring protein precursor FlgH
MEKNTVIQSSVLLAALLLISQVVYAQSLYQDITAKSEGDIITVVLTENISGRSNSGSRVSSNAESGAGGSASGNFLPFEPTFGTDVEVNYDSDASADASQGQLLEGYMTVQVIGVPKNGLLEIEGTRTTEINGETHEMKLHGMVRRKDIHRNNQIPSYKISNAKINYSKKGGTNSLTKQRGFIKRAAIAGVGLALSAAVIFRAIDF